MAFTNVSVDVKAAYEQCSKVPKEFAETVATLKQLPSRYSVEYYQYGWRRTNSPEQVANMVFAGHDVRITEAPPPKKGWTFFAPEPTVAVSFSGTDACTLNLKAFAAQVEGLQK